MAKMPRGGWRQRFDVTGGPPSGVAGSANEAYDRILAAEKRALDDFKNGLITADEAMAEYAASLRRYGREAGATIDQRQNDADRVEFLLDRLAGAAGQPGVSKEPPVDLTRYMDQVVDLTKHLDKLPIAKLTAEAAAERELYKQLDEALDKFRKGLITAEEAARRQAGAIDRLGEKAGMTVGERWQEQRSQFAGLTDAAMQGGQPPPIDPKNPLPGQLGNAFERFGLPADIGKQLGGVLNQFGGAGLNLGGGAIGGFLKSLGSMGGGAGGPPGIGAGFSGMAGGAGGAAGLASVAGPLAAVTAGAKVLEGFYDGVQNTTRRIGDMNQAMVSNDGLEMMSQWNQGVADMVGKVPLVGGMLQSQIEMYGEFLRTFDRMTEAFEQRGRQISQYDGNIATAVAVSDTDKLLADIREAQQLGNQYAEIISQRTQLQVQFQEALTPIKGAIMEVLIPILQNLNTFVGVVGSGVQQVADVGKDIKTAHDQVVEYASSLPLAKDTIVAIRKMIEQFPWVKKQKDEPSAILQLLDIGRRALDADTNIRRPEPTDGAPLNINLFDMMR
jgi:hypothetical protein